MQDVPWHIARRLVAALNEQSTTLADQPTQTHPAQGGADTIFHRYVKKAFQMYWAKMLGIPENGTERTPSTTGNAPATSGRPESARRLQEWLQHASETDLAKELPHLTSQLSPAHLPSLGYVTADSCPGYGDDTVHMPIPYSDEQPEFVGAQPHPVPEHDDTPVDVVFVDFVAESIVQLLNMFDTQRIYTRTELQVWGNVTTELLYSAYAQLHWQPESVLDAWSDMDAAATSKGYPPLSHFDSYPGDPYEVVKAHNAPSLVFQ